MFNKLTNKKLQDELFERIQGLHTYESLAHVVATVLVDLPLRNPVVAISRKEDATNLYYSVKVEATVGFFFKRGLKTQISRNYRIGCGDMEV